MARSCDGLLRHRQSRFGLARGRIKRHSFIGRGGLCPQKDSNLEMTHRKMTDIRFNLRTAVPLTRYRTGRFKNATEDGARRRTRTFDPLIKSQLLYQLSYAGSIMLLLCLHCLNLPLLPTNSPTFISVPGEFPKEWGLHRLPKL